jgi:hypothetical protein
MMNKPRASFSHQGYAAAHRFGPIARLSQACRAVPCRTAGQGYRRATAADQPRRTRTPASVSKKHVDKTYFVRADQDLTPEDAAAFQEGMVLGDGFVCLPAGLGCWIRAIPPSSPCGRGNTIRSSGCWPRAANRCATLSGSPWDPSRWTPP